MSKGLLYTVSSIQNGVATLCAETDHLVVELPASLIPDSATASGSVVSLSIRHDTAAEAERAERRVGLQELVKESARDFKRLGQQ